MKGNLFYIDANALVSYLIKGHPLHDKSMKLLLSSIRKESLIALSPLVVDEVLYVVSFLKKQGILEGKVSALVEQLSKANFVFVNLRNWNSKVIKEVYRFMRKYRLKPRDAFHLKIMLDNHIKYLLTFDKDFNIVAGAGLMQVVSLS